MQTRHELMNEESTDPEISIRKSYEKPELVLWGDLRGLTLGPSSGTNESGSNHQKKNAGPGG
jgi:hypothetical protein